MRNDNVIVIRNVCRLKSLGAIHYENLRFLAGLKITTAFRVRSQIILPGWNNVTRHNKEGLPHAKCLFGKNRRTTFTETHFVSNEHTLFLLKLAHVDTLIYIWEITALFELLEHVRRTFNV